MSDKAEIIQNAARVKSTGEILISQFRHDYKESKCGTCSVDGGKEYIRRSFIDKNDIEELSLSSDSTIELKAQRMIWGTYGIDGKQPLKYVLLNECETSHLENIIKNGFGEPEIRKVVIYILEQRTKK